MAGEPPWEECQADLAPLLVHLAAVRELGGSRKFLFCASSHVGSLIPDAGQRLTLRGSSRSSSSPGGRELVGSASLEFPWFVGEAL